jgi:hypothetical protein
MDIGGLLVWGSVGLVVGWLTPRPAFVKNAQDKVKSWLGLS